MNNEESICPFCASMMTPTTEDNKCKRCNRNKYGRKFERQLFELKFGGKDYWDFYDGYDGKEWRGGSIYYGAGCDDCGKCQNKREGMMNYMLDRMFPTGIENEWKPKIGETYWYITDELEFNDITLSEADYHKKRIILGNCFRTKEEAEAKLKEVLAVFKK